MGASAQEVIDSFAVQPAAAELAALRAEVERLREELGAIAEQKLIDEMDTDEWTNADFADGYESCVRIARQALGGTDGRS